MAALPLRLIDRIRLFGIRGGVDNTLLNVGVGGDTIASDDIGGIKFQRVKMVLGADGTNAGDVALTNPMPITPAASSLPVNDAGGTLTVDGTVTANAGSGNFNVTPAAGSIPVTDAGSSLTVDGTITANAGSGTFAMTPAAGSIPVTDAGGSLTIDGTVTADAGSGTFSVTPAAGSIPVTDAGGTLTVDGTITANAGSGNFTVTPAGGSLHVNAAGDVAHDSPDAGEPVKVGGRAIAHGANPTAVAADDRSNWYFNRAGIPFILGGHPNIITLETAAAAAFTDAAVVTVAGGQKIVVTQAQMVADNANTVDVGFRLGFGTAATPTTTGVVLTHPGVAAGSGVSRGDGSGIIGIGADGEDLRLTNEVPTTGSIRILVDYFTVES